MGLMYSGGEGMNNNLVCIIETNTNLLKNSLKILHYKVIDFADIYVFLYYLRN